MPRKHIHNKRKLIETHYIENEPATVIVEMWTLDHILRRIVELDDKGFDYTFKCRQHTYTLDVKI